MKQQPASALLVVLGMMVIVSGVLLHAWFVGSLRFDVLAGREQSWINFYAAQATLNLGLASLREQFPVFLSQAAGAKKSLVIDVTASLFDGSCTRQRALVFIKKSADTQMRDALRVHARVYQNDRCVSAVACVLRKQTMRNQESRFVVSHFTVSPRV